MSCLRDRELTLLAGTYHTRITLLNQLNAIIGDCAIIESFSIEEGLPSQLSNKTILLSSSLIYQEVHGCIGQNCHLIIAERTIDYEHIEPLLLLKEGTQVLFVSDCFYAAMESIQNLNNVGINHVEYIPYAPDRIVPSAVPIAVTTGEQQLVPIGVKTTINLGSRLIDLSTIFEILRGMETNAETVRQVSSKYLRRMVDLSKKLIASNQRMEKLNSHLEKVVNGLNEAVIAIDQLGKIVVYNEKMEELSGISAQSVVGKELSLYPRLKQVNDFLHEGEYVEDLILLVNEIEVLANRFVLHTEGTIIATFKAINEMSPAERQTQKELLKKGHVAKYTFDDIIGISNEITKAKELASKLASTELPILIQAETGTGKELFASAIHHYSDRRNKPFLAINFSALPEDLLESELFGYVEGAFTGAKRGGKEGLFEQADGGTIFLDEIGDISPKLQARLLRVLQEKEVRRIGGTKNISIDFRMIAATNRNLPNMIMNGKFRQDLYHRLKVLYLELPPLRQREGDISYLLNYFIKLRGSFHVDASLSEVMSALPWKGNIRELKNTIDYMMAVSTGSTLTVNDLPSDQFFAVEGKSEPHNEILLDPTDDILNSEEEILLQIMFSLVKEAQSISRKRISLLSEQHGLNLTEQQVRHRLQQLENKGFLQVLKGRNGTKLTAKGMMAGRRLIQLINT